MYFVNINQWEDKTTEGNTVYGYFGGQKAVTET